MNTGFLDPAVATVLTACGIETYEPCLLPIKTLLVATVLTACGIETDGVNFSTFTGNSSCNSTYRLRY